MDALFFIKVAAVPLLLWGTSLVARRWGPFLGAILAGLPLVSGPVSLFITLEQGTQFGAGMAYNTLPGICVCVAYTVIYAWLSRRFRWPQGPQSSAGQPRRLSVPRLFSLSVV